MIHGHVNFKSEKQYCNLGLLIPQISDAFYLLQEKFKNILWYWHHISKFQAQSVASTALTMKYYINTLTMKYQTNTLTIKYHINNLTNKVVTPMKHVGFFTAIHKRMSV
jgi:hypothetical protein